MVDVSQFTSAKSDQLNADDLLGGPRTVTVTRVAGTDQAEQPISIFFEGDNGKPYKPGKSMRRVLVALWGNEGADYVGRSMTLYRDSEVAFGGIKVGGVRISHMSHLDRAGDVPLTVTRGSKKMFNVKPLEVEKPKPPARSVEEKVDGYVARVAACATLDDLLAFQTDAATVKFVAAVKAERPDLRERIVAANSERARDLTPPSTPADDAPAAADDDDGLGLDFSNEGKNDE